MRVPRAPRSCKVRTVYTYSDELGKFPAFSWMYSTEHVLFGRIGHLKVERKGLRLDFEAKVTRHSAKPETFYERVVRGESWAAAGAIRQG